MQNDHRPERSQVADGITIRLRDNGPMLIEGAVQILDAEGKPFAANPDKPVIALCRCGKSENMPYCDGHHKECGFQTAERA